MFLNRPAAAGMRGIADESKNFGDVSNQVAMVWETWALASGGAVSEVYKLDGSRPANWDDLSSAPRELVLDTNLERSVVLGESKLIRPRFFPPAPLSQEVRMNRATFEFIVAKTMYNIDGLEALQASAAQTKDRDLIKFTAGSKEVKAQWERITDDQKSRYLWRSVANPDGTQQAFGLVSLHIITKDLPNWFWADFGHIDCEQRLNACHIDLQEVAQTSPRDSTTRGPNDTAGPSGKDGVRNEAIGTVWANYILRGTQTNFVAADGRATILSNPVIENTFQQSSCMTCHARAAVGARLRNADGSFVRQINRLSPGDPELGVPDPALFGDSPAYNINEIRFLQSDFLWSPIFRAKRKSP